MARGVSPTSVQVLTIENVDVATPQSMAAMVLYLVPFFLVFAVFGGGMYLAIDATAGERERGSLEPLLINPVGRAELVLGKLGAIIVFSVLAVLGTLVGFAVMLRLLPLEKLFGVSLMLDPLALAGVFLIALPMTLLASALQMVIGSYTRSYKEAQSYLGFLPLVPGLPGMVIGLIPFKIELWAMLIPAFGQQLLINQVLRGEEVSPLNVSVSALVTVVAGMALVLFTIRLYERETALGVR
jgi:sodium transport system permease protein